MADLQKTIEIIFQGDDQLSPSTVKMVSAVNTVAESVEKATQPIADFTNKLLLIESAVAVAGAALVYFATQEAVEYESALLDLQKVMDETDGSVSNWTGSLEDLSLEYGVLLPSVTQMAAELTAQGYSMQDVTRDAGLLESALIATKISNLDAEQAAALLVRTLNGLELGVDDATHVLDVWNKISDVTSASFESLAEATARVAPSLEAFNFSIDEGAAILTVLLQALGDDASKAAVAFEAVMARLIKGTGETSEGFKLLTQYTGIQIDSFAGVKDKAELVSTAFAALTDKQKEEVAVLIGGQQHLTETIYLFENWQKVIDLINLDKTDSAMKELAIRMQAADEIANRMFVSFNNLAIAIGGDFLIAQNDANKALTDLFKTMKEMVDSGALLPLLNALEPAFYAIIQAIYDINKNLPEAFKLVNFDNLINAIKNLSAALGGIFDGIDVSTPEGLAKAIELVSNAIAGLLNTTAGIVTTYLEPIIKAFIAMADSGGKLSPEMQELVGHFFGISTSLNKILEVGGTVVGIFKDLALAFGGAAVVASYAEGVKGVAAGIAGIQVAAGTVLGGLTELGLYWLGTEGLEKYVGWINKLVLGYDEVEGASAEVGKETEALDSLYKQITESTGVLIKNSDDLFKAQLAGTIVFDEATQTWKAADKAVTDLGASAKEAADGSNALTKAADGTSDKVKVLYGVTESATSSIKLLGVGMSSAATSASDASKDFDKLSTAANKLPEEIKLELDTTSIKANTEIAINSLESISTVISETTNLIGELFGLLVSNPDTPFVEEILEQIRTENELREEAWEVQKALMEAWLEYLEAKTAKLNANDALIQIDGAGLQPHLEAFMWEILQTIQVRVNEEGLDLLVGL